MQGTSRQQKAVYRDCSTLDGANFDNPAAITIYSGNNSPYNQIENIGVGIAGSVEFVPPDDIPCLIPPSGICVEKATYIFTRALQLEGLLEEGELAAQGILDILLGEPRLTGHRSQ